MRSIVMAFAAAGFIGSATALLGAAFIRSLGELDNAVQQQSGCAVSNPRMRGSIPKAAFRRESMSRVLSLV